VSFGRSGERLDTALALATTTLVLFVVANSFPMMAIDIGGRGQSVRLGSGIGGLVDHGFMPLAVFVAAISIMAPLGRIMSLSYVVYRVRSGVSNRSVSLSLRIAEMLRPWSMLDVFLIGALVSLTKLHNLARVDIGVGFWALGLLVVTLAAFEITIDRLTLWNALADQQRPRLIVRSEPYIGCRECSLVQSAGSKCLRCGRVLLRRKSNSLQKTAALVLTGLILYVPANLYPVITVISFGHDTRATIFGGIMELMDGSDWPLALIILTASVFVPLLKLVGLGWLLVSTRLGLRTGLIFRTRLYRVIELVSRWSTVDIFVAALLTALVTLGNIATIEPGIGALAFGAVVFVTMIATECFDPRLMWDAAGANDV
jgi:paraquat-inducible protein A